MRSLVRQLRDVMQNQMSKLHVQLFFVFGRQSGLNEANTKRFADEQAQFDDFIIGDFVDAYDNLTLKTWTGHHFLNSGYYDKCSNVKWTLFHDDDAFVDYTLVEKRLMLFPDSSRTAGQFLCLFGGRYTNRNL